MSDRDQAALAAWFDVRRASSLENLSEDSLLCSLEAASQEIEAGRGVPIEEVRRRVAS
jgi:hypothetical protein